jgi:uridine phosphorylase
VDVKTKTLPILEFPGSGRAIIEPRRLLAGRKPVPERCVLCFFGEVIRNYRKRGELRKIHTLSSEGAAIDVYALGRGKSAVTVSLPGLTAPYAAAVLEELIALGGRKFIVCGSAGVLDSSVPPGKVIIPDRALRDEGTSYHYLKAERTVRPHPAALRAIEQACRARKIDYLRGMTWTTDAVYRETPRQIRRRRKEGCLTVDMEAAAFYAVARFRKVELGQILYAGDDISGSDWKPRGWNRRRKTRENLFLLAVDACRRMG